MSDIQYDTRTGAVMAGGLTGSGHKVGAAMKQQLARIRAACNQGEANNKSNQDLILLLENYNDQVDMVIESLRTGDADKTTGGWETTGSKKGKAGKHKKASESDSLNHQHQLSADSGSISNQSGNRNKVPLQNDAQPSGGGKKKKSQAEEQPQERPTLAQPQAAMVSGPKKSNGQHAGTVPEAKKESRKKHLDHEAAAHSHPLPPPKDVAVQDIFTHCAALKQLLTQLTDTHGRDLKSVDEAVVVIHRELERRFEELRRSLQENCNKARQSLEARQRQSAELSARVTQSRALTPEEYAQWQEESNAFMADYKLDLHLATTPKFSPLSEAHFQELLRSFFHVHSVSPSYAIKSSTESVPASGQHHSHNHSEAALGRSAAQTSASSHPSTTSNNDNNNNNSKNTAFKSQQHQSPAVPQQKTQPELEQRSSHHHHSGAKADYTRERVTIVPKGSAEGSAAPLNSLVISGGNLTPEEMAALTLSLQNSLRYPAASAAAMKPIGAGLGSGSGMAFAGPDIFTEGAIWTNSNSAVSDQWNSHPPVTGDENGSHAFSANGDYIRPIGEPNFVDGAAQNGGAPRGGQNQQQRGGTGGNRGGRGRGGGGGRGAPHRGGAAGYRGGQ